MSINKYINMAKNLYFVLFKPSLYSFDPFLITAHYEGSLGLSD